MYKVPVKLKRVSSDKKRDFYPSDREKDNIASRVMSADHLYSVLLLKEKDGAALQVFKEALIVFTSGTLPICHGNPLSQYR